MKQRLDRIQIKGTNSGLSGNLGVAGAVIGSAAIVGIAGWLAIHSAEKKNDIIAADSNTTSTFTPTEKNTFDTAAEAEKAIASESLDTFSGSVTEPKTSVSKQSENSLAVQAVKSKPKATEKTTAPSPARPTLPSQEMLSAGGNEPIQKDEVVELPYSKIASSTERVNDKLTIVDNSDARIKLHYRYTDGQLTLYGFEKPYRIIDVVNANAGKQRYLFYSERFYYLDQNQKEISPLKEVTDEPLIQELNDKIGKMTQ